MSISGAVSGLLKAHAGDVGDHVDDALKASRDSDTVQQVAATFQALSQAYLRHIADSQASAAGRPTSSGRKLTLLPPPAEYKDLKESVVDANRLKQRLEEQLTYTYDPVARLAVRQDIATAYRAVADAKRILYIKAQELNGKGVDFSAQELDDLYNEAICALGEAAVKRGTSTLPNPFIRDPRELGIGYRISFAVRLAFRQLCRC